MKAMFTMLTGGWRTLGLIALAVGLDLALEAGGRPFIAALLLPLFLLGGIAWLARAP